MQRENTLVRISSKANNLTLDEQAALGVLKYLEKDELQELNDSEEKLEDLISDQQQVGFSEGC